MLRQVFAVLMTAPLIAAPSALAQTAKATRFNVPRLNVETVCTEIARTAGDPRDKEACLRRENASRTALTRQWAEFPAADRASCYSLATMGGVGGTYSELLTCLEMSRDVRKLRGGTVGRGSGAIRDISR